MALEIVLVEPEIPQNTGNIARTCVATGSRLHLVEPLGFSLEDRYLKRAGLDYWFDLNPMLWPDLESCLRHFSGRPLFYATTKGGQCYADAQYPQGSVLFFGKETRGLPESLLMAHPERCVRIPMLPGYRSLNLSNAVAVLTYEVLRQSGFALMETSSQVLKDPYRGER